MSSRSKSLRKVGLAALAHTHPTDAALLADPVGAIEVVKRTMRGVLNLPAPEPTPDPCSCVVCLSDVSHLARCQVTGKVAGRG